MIFLPPDHVLAFVYCWQQLSTGLMLYMILIRELKQLNIKSVHDQFPDERPEVIALLLRVNNKSTVY